MALPGNVFLIQGTETILPKLLSVLEEEGIDTDANPDIDVRTYPQFKVDDARMLVDRAQLKSISTRRVFVVISPNLLYEAQNTILKTLEEPPGNALFFFVVPSPAALLSTVRSRAQILEIESDAYDRHDAATFLKSTPPQRLEMLKPYLEKDGDDVRDISGAIAFLSDLEQKLSFAEPLPREGIEAVYRARKYLSDKGSLIKSLLEQVALLVPVRK